MESTNTGLGIIYKLPNDGDPRVELRVWEIEKDTP